MQINKFNYKSHSNALNSNQIRYFAIRISKVQKINFVPRLCPRHSRDVFFCPFFVPRALRGTKMPIFEVKSDEIQTSANMN